MFEDISDRIRSNSPGRYRGVAVADIDADNRFEFMVAGFGSPNRVLKWIEGQLLDVASPAIAETGRQTVAFSAGDIDGDGREEIYIANSPRTERNQSSADRLMKWLPGGQWENMFARPENLRFRNAFSSDNVAVIDRRGVGRYGFLATCDDRAMNLFELGPDGALADLAPALGFSHASRTRGVLTLPIVSPHPDLFCLSDSGPNLVYRNRGDGTFAECGAGLGLADDREQGLSITPVDTGGTLGLSWGNWDGPHRLMLPQAEACWKDAATPGLAFPSSIDNLIAADFDNDGHDELLFINRGEPNRLFRVLNAGTETVMLDAGDALDSNGQGTGVAVCDIDGDGVLEVLIARGEEDPQAMGLYKARAAVGNHWLRIRPLTRYGAPARGAIVRAEVDGRLRAKGICGGSGYRCQMEPVAHFGLGPSGRATRIQIIWPDGAEVELLNPRSNRTIAAPYPRG